MKIIDTHFHPEDLIEFEKIKNNTIYSNEKIIEESKKNMLEAMFCISTSINNFSEYINNSLMYKEYYFSIGIHPCEVKNNELEDTILKLKDTIALCKKNKFKIIGIGETGIDFYREEDRMLFQKQEILFNTQIELCIINKLPLIIHTRNATIETYQIMKNYSQKLNGTIHAFCDDYTWAKKFIDLGFKLGIGGAITYPKNEHIRDAVKKVGIKHILLETDAPFLPIQSMRGKVNHPQYCYNIGIYIANLLNIEKEICFEQIYNNTINIFEI
jgi:TatD DNase family protein